MHRFDASKYGSASPQLAPASQRGSCLQAHDPKQAFCSRVRLVNASEDAWRADQRALPGRRRLTRRATMRQYHPVPGAGRRVADIFAGPCQTRRIEVGPPEAPPGAMPQTKCQRGTLRRLERRVLASLAGLRR